MSRTLRFQILLGILLVALLTPQVPARRLWPQGGTPPQQLPVQSPPPQPAPPQKGKPSETQSANQDQGAVVRINTQLVQVDAVVTDKNGKHIDDLDENDFELLVDGKPQSITHFKFIKVPIAKRELPANPTPKSSPKNEPARPTSMPTKQIAPEKVQRTIAFVVDDLGLSFPDMVYARSAVKKFVDEQMQDGDLVGIICTGRGLGALQQFTSDRRILYAAIESLTFNPQSRNMMPGFGANARVTADQDDIAQQQTNDFNNFNDVSSSLGTLGALNFVVRSLHQLPGRKMVVLVSDGFNIMGTSGDDNQVIEELKHLADQANRSSAVIYALDAKGLQTLMPGAGDDMSGTSDDQLVQQVLDASVQNLDSLAGMHFLAAQTGGFLRFNANDLDLGVKKIIEDNETYYLIGFDPEDEKFNGKYHQIKVRVKRPGLQVRTRGGFYGTTEAEAAPAPKTRTQQILSTLYSPFGARDIPVQMTSFFFNLNAKGSFVRTFFHIDSSKLTFKDGPNHGKTLTIDLATFAFNADGESVDQHAETKTFDLSEQQYQEALVKGIRYETEVPIKKPGPYQFHAVIRDPDTGRLGSSTQFIQVPDLSKKQLALSGLALTAPKAKPGTPAAASVMPAAANQTTQPAAQTNAAVQPANRPDINTSPAVRRFPRNSEIEYATWIFNATAKSGQTQLTWQIEIYCNGKRVYQAPPHPLPVAKNTSLQRIPCGGQLRITDSFPPGEYMLRVIVTDALAKQKNARADQWTDFTVVK